MASSVRPEIRVSADVKALGTYAAELFASLSGEAISTRKTFRTALSGGSTPLPLYSFLAIEPYRSRIDWENVEIFFSDERCVPPEHHESNFKAVNESLLSHIPSKVHRIRGEMPPWEAALRYEEDIRRAFGFGEGLPVLDLVLLGLGADGHTASLFPGTEVLGETEKLAAAVFVSQHESWRVTLTFPVINAARKVVFLVSGKSKARVVKDVIESRKDYPASRVAPSGGSVLWLLDRDAASLL